MFTEYGDGNGKNRTCKLNFLFCHVVCDGARLMIRETGQGTACLTAVIVLV